MFAVDEAHNKAMKIGRIQSRALLFRRQLSIEEPAEGDEVQPSSTMADLLEERVQ